jgi:hypothetical protein
VTPKANKLKYDSLISSPRSKPLDLTSLNTISLISSTARNARKIDTLDRSNQRNACAREELHKTEDRHIKDLGIELPVVDAFPQALCTRAYARRHAADIWTHNLLARLLKLV